MKVTIERDGFKFIGILFIVGIVSLFLFWPLAVVFLVIMAGVALFFRETKRDIRFGPNDIVAPASGKLIDIREVFEPEFLKARVVRLSIFMSLFDQHINYAPITGTVTYLKHREGGFKKAYLDEASDCNEAQKIGLRGPDATVLVIQIAGIVARRIVCRCRVGTTLEAGEKLGLIRFGSRVELFLPPSAQLGVSTGQRVRGGATLLGKLQ